MKKKAVQTQFRGHNNRQRVERVEQVVVGQLAQLQQVAQALRYLAEQAEEQREALALCCQVALGGKLDEEQLAALDEFANGPKAEEAPAPSEKAEE